jgi:hypothetical protein
MRACSFGITLLSPAAAHAEPHTDADRFPVIELRDATAADLLHSLLTTAGIRVNSELPVEGMKLPNMTLHDRPAGHTLAQLQRLLPTLHITGDVHRLTIRMNKSPLASLRGRFAVAGENRARALARIGEQIERASEGHIHVNVMFGGSFSQDALDALTAPVTMDVTGTPYDALDALIAGDPAETWSLVWQGDRLTMTLLRTRRIATDRLIVAPHE